jgi:hypothetical protein
MAGIINPKRRYGFEIWEHQKRSPEFTQSITPLRVIKGNQQ